MSSFVRYFTRFTEESFAALVGIIFIVEALKKLYSKFNIILIFVLFTKVHKNTFFAEMSTLYKVHTGFHLNEVAFEEEYCHCIPANKSM